RPQQPHSLPVKVNDFNQLVEVGREHSASKRAEAFYRQRDLLPAPEHLFFFLALHFLPERGSGRRRQYQGEHHHSHQADQRVASLSSFSRISSFIRVPLIFIYVHTMTSRENYSGREV